MIKGYFDNTFKPNKSITRAEFIAIVNRAISFNDKGEVKFNDVKQNDWFYKDLQIAFKNYITGFSDNTFRPDNLILREQAASIIARIKSLGDDLETANKFVDSKNTSSWAKGSVGAVVASKLMQGTTDNMFNPTKALTRAEAIVVLQNQYTSKTASFLMFMQTKKMVK